MLLYLIYLPETHTCERWNFNNEPWDELDSGMEIDALYVSVA